MESKETPTYPIGMRNGHLVVVGLTKDGKWLCECDCGGTRTVGMSGLAYTKNCGIDCPYRGQTITKVDRKSIKLKPGHTYEEYILLTNQDKPYSLICEYLSINLNTARDIYDKISALDISDIGSIREIRGSVGRE